MAEEREYQKRVVANTLKAIDEGHKSILITSPCGSGKTFMGHTIAAELNRRHGWKTGWTAMRWNLLQQAAEENKRLVGLDNIEYFSTFDRNPPLDVDILIEDEGHHAASATATHLTSVINPKIHIALTATPFRSDRVKLSFSKIVQDAGVKQLIEEGWLSAFDQYIAKVAWTPYEVAKLYSDHQARWGKTVVYFLSIAECEECQKALLDAGVPSEVVYQDSDIDAQLEMFATGNTRVLLNVVMLTEGFNSPDLQTVFVRPASKGPTIQMAGRVLRKHPECPVKNIVQVEGTKWPFSRIAGPHDRLALNLLGEWDSRRGESARLIKVCATSIIGSGRTAVKPMPRYIVSHTKRKHSWHRKK